MSRDTDEHQPDAGADALATTGVGHDTPGSSADVTITSTGRGRHKVRPVVDHDLDLVGADRYEIRGEYNRGGIGRILVARDRQLGRPVAVKELMIPTAAAEARFFREAMITGRLEHPSIVPVHELGRLDSGKPFYAMKMIEGRTLKELLFEAQTPQQRLALIGHVVAVSEAVAYAHSKGIVHRDLKPSNIIVGEYGETIVIDWGLAKVLDESDDDLKMAPSGEVKRAQDDDLTVVGQVLGTPAYMPPEQARGEDVREPADVYALGAILYHLLARELPHPAPTSDEVLATKARGDGPPGVRERAPWAPRDLAAIVDKAMAKQPADRYATAKQLAADLRRFRANQSVRAYDYSAPERLGRWLSRHRTVTIAAGCLLVLAIVVAVWLATREQRLRRNAETALDAAELARDVADRQSLALLKQQGRAELEAGRPSRSAILLSAAFTRDPSDRETHALLTTAMWQIELMDRTHTLRGHRDQVTSISFDADGTRAVTSSADATARVWNIATGAELYTLTHPTRVRAAKLSGDGAVIATADDEKIRLWNAETGTLVRTLDAAASGWHLALSADGSRLAVLLASTKIQLWDTLTGEPLDTVDITPGYPVGVEYTRDGSRLVAATMNGVITVIDARTGAITQTMFQEGTIDDIALSGDSSTLLTGGVGGVRLWDIATGALLKIIPQPEPVDQVAYFGPDEYILTANKAGTLRVFSPSGSPLAAVDTVQDGTIFDLAASPDGQHLIIGDDTGRADVWHVAVDRLPRMLRTGANVQGAEYSPDGTRIAAAETSGTVRVIDAGTGESLVVLEAYERSAWVARWSPDGARIATTMLLENRGGADVKLWDANSGALIGSLEGHTDTVYDLAFTHRDGARVATASWDGSVRIWDAKTLAQIGDPILPVSSRDDPYGKRTSALAWSPDDRRLATGSHDGHLRVWDAATGALLLDIAAHTSAIDAVAFSPDGTHLASGGYDDHVAKLWSADTGALERVFEGHAARLMATSFSPDGSLVATAGFDHTARLWDTNSGALLRTIAGPLHVAVFRSDSRRLLTNGAGPELVEWDIDLDPRTPAAINEAVGRRSRWWLREGKLELRTDL